MSRVFVPLCDDEKNALLKLAEIELRLPVDQARFIIRQELSRRGLLVIQADPSRVEASPIPTKEETKTN